MEYLNTLLPNNSPSSLTTIVSDNGEKSPRIFFCEKCNYTTSKNSDYLKHLKTKKHTIDVAENKDTCANCKKIYSSASNLWKHKQKCNTKFNSQAPPFENQLNSNDIIIELLRQNKDLHSFIIENQKTIIENQSTSFTQNKNPTYNAKLFKLD
jgi:hypothetical protein